MGLADVLGDRQQLEPVGRQHEPDRRGVPGQQPHPAHGVEQRLAPDDEAVRVRRRDQAPVVRELALDQPGGDPGRADLEGGVALAEAQRDGVGAAEQALDLAQRPRRHEHARPAAEGARLPGQVAHGEAVGVGGDEAQPALLGGQQHAGDDRPVVVGRRRRRDLAQRQGELLGLELHRLGVGDRAASGTRRPAAPAG